MDGKFHYFRAGMVERGPRYQWRDAYSKVDPNTGGNEYPWLTKREAQAEAKAAGGTAVFHETKIAALLAAKSAR